VVVVLNRRRAMKLAKDGQTPCINYICAGSCKKGKQSIQGTVSIVTSMYHGLELGTGTGRRDRWRNYTGKKGF